MGLRITTPLTIALSKLRGRTNEELLAELISELTQYFSLEEISIETGILNEDLDTLIASLVVIAS